MFAVFMLRIVCKTGRVSSLRRGSVIVTVGDATVAWETEFVYQVKLMHFLVLHPEAKFMIAQLPVVYELDLS